MQEGAFQLSEADPCMLYIEDERGICIIIIYIDDMLIIHKEEAIDAAIKVLQGHHDQESAKATLFVYKV